MTDIEKRKNKKRKPQKYYLTAKEKRDRDELRIEMIEMLRSDKLVAIDQVDSYIQLWETRILLKKDIAKRGVVVHYDNGGGQSGVKKNDSIDQLNKIASQMQRIYDDLFKDKTTGMLINDEPQKIPKL